MSVSQPVAVIGRYALHDEIASGGMATVHLGRLLGPVGFARTVAIKRLHQQYAKDPEFVSMFLDEARLAARIRHPNVVPTLDVVALSGELFLVMDYVHGVSLSRLSRAASSQKTHIPVEIAASILVGALHGLHAAHQARSERGLALGIVHRDVSPQNIIVGSDGLARVLDFGVAKASWRIQTTRDGQVKGKLAYMAPEQVNGGEIGPWTDVYAAGIVLWEALANRRLFTGGDGPALLARFTKHEPVAPPSTHHPGLAPGLDAVVEKALAAETSARFASAQEMADAIEACTPLASSSTVARWVQSVAGSELDGHSALITEIEHGSSVSSPPPNADSPSVRRMLATVSSGDGEPRPARNAASADAIVTQTAEHAPATSSALADQTSSSAVSMTRSPHASEPPAARKKRFMRLGLGVAALGALALALGLFARSHAAQPTTGSEPGHASLMPALSHADGVTPAASAGPIANTTREASSAAPADAPASSASVTSASSAASAPSAPSAPSATEASSVKTPNNRATARPASARPGSACNPPYIVDARGIRHMKLACLH